MGGVGFSIPSGLGLASRGFAAGRVWQSLNAYLYTEAPGISVEEGLENMSQHKSETVGDMNLYEACLDYSAWLAIGLPTLRKNT